MQHKLTHLHYICQNYNNKYPKVQDEEPYNSHDKGDSAHSNCHNSTWGGIPMSTTCPIAKDYINNPCRRPLCAHFHAFGQAAYITKTTKALQAHKAKTNRMLQHLSEIGSGLTSLPIFNKEDKELKPESQFESINMLAMLQLQGMIKKARPKLTMALDLCARLKHKVCPICKALTPMDSLINMDDFAQEASTHNPTKSPSISYPPSWNLSQTTYSYHNSKSCIVNAVITMACHHTRQPICLTRTRSILCNAKNVLWTLIKLKGRIKHHYDDMLDVLNNKKDPSMAPFHKAHKIIKRIQEMLYKYAKKICKCPYPSCSKPLLSSTGKILLKSTPATKAFQARVDSSSPCTIRLRDPKYICIDNNNNNKKKRKHAHKIKRKPKQAHKKQKTEKARK